MLWAGDVPSLHWGRSEIDEGLHAMLDALAVPSTWVVCLGSGPWLPRSEATPLLGDLREVTGGRCCPARWLDPRTTSSPAEIGVAARGPAHLPLWDRPGVPYNILLTELARPDVEE